MTLNENISLNRRNCFILVSDFLFLYVIDMYFKIDIMNLVIDVVLMLLTFLWLCQWILSSSQGTSMVKHKNCDGTKTYKNKMLNHIYEFQCNKISFVPSWDDKNEVNLRKIVLQPKIAWSLYPCCYQNWDEIF